METPVFRMGVQAWGGGEGGGGGGGCSKMWDLLVLS